MSSTPPEWVWKALVTTAFGLLWVGTSTIVWMLPGHKAMEVTISLVKWFIVVPILVSMLYAVVKG